MDNMQVQDLIKSALPGAMDHGQGMATFAIYAPGKQSVHLAASFNSWDWKSDPLMDRGGGFWVIKKELPQGKYAYRFVIDQNLQICDPYSQQVELSNGGPEVCSVVEFGFEGYSWQHDDWQCPALKDLILYEINIGDFTPEGNFQGVLSKLPYLRDIGINAIELMPVYECAPDDYWGYKPMFFLAPRRRFGSPEDLKILIDTAHDQGLAVILDIVLAHTAPQHPLNKLYPYDQSPWYGEPIGEKNQFGLPTLDYRKTATNSFARDVQFFWFKEYHNDGFRYDYLPAIGNKDSDLGMPYLIRTGRDIRPQAFLIGECLPEKPDMVRDSDLSAVWHGRFERALDCLLQEKDIEPYRWDDFDTTIQFMDPAKQDYHSADFMVNYIESHDEHRMADLLKSGGFTDEIIYRKLILGATVLMVTPGEPMLHNGEEWGEDTPKSEKQNPLHWDRLDTEWGHRLYEHHRAICRLRRAHAALRSEQFAFAAVYPEQKSMVAHRWNGEMDQIVIVANFSSLPQKFDVPFRQSGKWSEYFSQEKLEVKDVLKLEIEPYSAKIFLLGSVS
jgi:1,4-alpha-glucan branching enzyme